MIITCILFVLFNIIYFKWLRSSFSEIEIFILQLVLSVFSTILLTVVISLIACTVCNTETVLIESEKLVPYKNEKYIKENFESDHLYYKYNTKDRENISVQLTKNMYVSNNIKDKPKVERHIYRYKNKIIRYMFFCFEDDKYIYYIPKNGIIKYNNNID